MGDLPSLSEQLRDDAEILFDLDLAHFAARNRAAADRLEKLEAVAEAAEANRSARGDSERFINGFVAGALRASQNGLDAALAALDADTPKEKP